MRSELRWHELWSPDGVGGDRGQAPDAGRDGGEQFHQTAGPGVARGAGWPQQRVCQPKVGEVDTVELVTCGRA